MVKIRLRRVGAKNRPSYRLVVADVRAPRDGAFIAIIGHYNPLTDPETVVIDEGKARHWLSQGAQPTDTVARLLAKAGIIEESEARKEKIKAGIAPKPKASKKKAKAGVTEKPEATKEEPEASITEEPEATKEEPEASITEKPEASKKKAKAGVTEKPKSTKEKT
ncbi:MAG: 30S ribosomal protein S16 [Dehalococcoidia bacterium]|nr:30S ribosomal protein S16 [Dehalococcoidia bacterium]MDH5696233.1 30S ribosomal protein S16 [Dehalococcoidia bacterium]